ncbi:hypothetical protein ACLB2K_010586 [Fragaria x ananassa]
MSCFMFPKKICEEINAAMGNFWCGSSDHGNKVHQKGWSSLCIPKQDGGLGFKDLNHYNITLLAKQCWHILPQPYSLWVKVWQEKWLHPADVLLHFLLLARNMALDYSDKVAASSNWNFLGVVIQSDALEVITNIRILFCMQALEVIFFNR